MIGSATTIVAIVAPSVAAVLIAFINVRWSGSREEQARQRERNQERRAELYVDVLLFMRAAEQGVDPEDHPDEPMLSARMAAFGSEEVKRRLYDYWHAGFETRDQARTRIEEQIAKEMQATN